MSSFLDNDREGPEIIPEHIITVPEKRTCSGCKYFNRNLKTHRMMGPNEYETVCTHSNAWPEDSRLSDWARLISRGGGMLRDDATPEWCPFLREDNE